MILYTLIGFSTLQFLKPTFSRPYLIADYPFKLKIYNKPIKIISSIKIVNACLTSYTLLNIHFLHEKMYHFLKALSTFFMKYSYSIKFFPSVKPNNPTLNPANLYVKHDSIVHIKHEPAHMRMETFLL